jgi:hypothetical protein
MQHPLDILERCVEVLVVRALEQTPVAVLVVPLQRLGADSTFCYGKAS